MKSNFRERLSSLIKESDYKRDLNFVSDKLEEYNKMQEEADMILFKIYEDYNNNVKSLLDYIVNETGITDFEELQDNIKSYL